MKRVLSLIPLHRQWSQTSQGHKAAKWQSWASNPGRLTQSSWLLATALTCFCKMSALPTNSPGSCQMASEQVSMHTARAASAFHYFLARMIFILKIKRLRRSFFQSRISHKPHSCNHSSYHQFHIRFQEGAGCHTGGRAHRKASELGIMPRRLGQLVNLNLKTKTKNFQADQPTTADDVNDGPSFWAKEEPQHRQRISLTLMATLFLSINGQDHVRTRWESGHLQARERGLGWNQTRWHLRSGF